MKRAAFALMLLFGCQGDLGQGAQPVALDEAYFRCDVQPVLTKSCAAFACHGDARRYFHVFSRNRLRAQGEEQDRNAPLTETERASNFEAARAMVDASHPEASWLLMKPLDMSGGGYFHRGGEIFGGGNVFSTKDDPDFQVLDAWTKGKTADPACVEPGSDQ